MLNIHPPRSGGQAAVCDGTLGGGGFPAGDPRVSVVLRLAASSADAAQTYACARGGATGRRDLARGPGGRRDEPGAYAGQRLGLPEHGRGAVAGFGSRIVAYLIDSAACAR